MFVRGLIAAAVISIAFEATIAVGLLGFAYLKPFGLTSLATNGAELLHKLDTLDAGARTGAAEVTGGAQLVRPLLLSYNHAFENLANLFGTAGVILLVCVITQIIVLVAATRVRLIKQRNGPGSN